jgi:hypothetical protein
MRRVIFPLAAILLLLLLGSSVPAGAAKPQTWSGYISCSTEAKGAPPGDSDAVRKCLDKGGLTVIVLDDTHQVLTIENPNAVKGQEGHRVLITGDIDEKGIHVLSVRII